MDDGLFSFIMVDAVNDKTEHYKEMYDYAKLKGFGVSRFDPTIYYVVYPLPSSLKAYIADVDRDPGLCVSRNVHGRSEEDVFRVAAGWEPTPPGLSRVDLRAFEQDGGDIAEVEMEEAASNVEDAEKDNGAVTEGGSKDANKDDVSFHRSGRPQVGTNPWL